MLNRTRSLKKKIRDLRVEVFAFRVADAFEWLHQNSSVSSVVNYMTKQPGYSSSVGLLLACVAMILVLAFMAVTGRPFAWYATALVALVGVGAFVSALIVCLCAVLSMRESRLSEKERSQIGRLHASFREIQSAAKKAERQFHATAVIKALHRGEKISQGDVFERSVTLVDAAMIEVMTEFQVLSDVCQKTCVTKIAELPVEIIHTAADFPIVPIHLSRIADSLVAYEKAVADASAGGDEAKKSVDEALQRFEQSLNTLVEFGGVMAQKVPALA